MRAKYTVGDVFQVTKQYKDLRFPLEQYTIVSVDEMRKGKYLYRFILSQSIDRVNKNTYGIMKEHEIEEYFTLLPEKMDDKRFNVKPRDIFINTSGYKDGNNIIINTVYIANSVPMVDYNLIKEDVDNNVTVVQNQHAGYRWFLNLLKDNFSPSPLNHKRGGS